MFEVVEEIIGYSSIAPETVCFICGAIIIILLCVFIDLIYRLFRHFWR